MVVNFTDMKARIRVYKQLLRQCQVIMAGKDFEAALVAAEEARVYLRKIADAEKQPEPAQAALFATAEDALEEGDLRAAEDRR